MQLIGGALGCYRVVWGVTTDPHFNKSLKFINFIDRKNKIFTPCFFFNNHFVSIHVDVRFTHDYRDIVEDTDYAIFIQNPGLFMPLGQIKRFPCVARA